MTLAFVKPSVVQSKDGTGQPHENGPVNLALCMSIQRGKMNNGWFVCFKASSGVSSLWWFDSEEVRDGHYDQLTAVAISGELSRKPQTIAAECWRCGGN